MHYPSQALSPVLIKVPILIYPYPLPLGFINLQESPPPDPFARVIEIKDTIYYSKESTRNSQIISLRLSYN